MQVRLRLPTGTPKGVRPAHRSPVPSLGPVVAHVLVPSAQGAPFPFRLTILSRYRLWKWHRRIQVSSRDPNKTKENKTTEKETTKNNRTHAKPKNNEKQPQNRERRIKVPIPSRGPPTAPSTVLWSCCLRLPPSHSGLWRLLQP